MESIQSQGQIVDQFHLGQGAVLLVSFRLEAFVFSTVSITIMYKLIVYLIYKPASLNRRRISQ